MDLTKEETVDWGNITCNVTASATMDSGYLSTIDLSSLTVNSNGALGSNAIPSVWVTNGTGAYDFGNLTFSDHMPKSGTLSIQGENADIEINGESLMTMIRGIQDRLNIMRPNEKLEAEWDQLRELGEQYRALEKKLTEQGDMWEALKKMPPPEIK